MEMNENPQDYSAAYVIQAMEESMAYRQRDGDGILYLFLRIS